MKYAIIIPDGCADEPQATLGGKTPLQAAHVPGMDEIARLGVVGAANHVPPGFQPGSDVANMSLLGYDVHRHFAGRAPIEAAAQGIRLGPHDWAIRCNLVTIRDQVMCDFTGGHISTDEGRSLLASLQETCSPAEAPWRFHAGVSYRNLLLYRGESPDDPPFSMEIHTTPPHDLTDQSIRDAFPRGWGSDRLVEWMDRSAKVFKDHPVNRARMLNGAAEVTHVWLWGLGKSPAMDSFFSRHGRQGKMITAVDLLRGLARLIGWEVLEVPGATGYTDTDYAAKGRYACAALESTDVICVHVEATDEASHEGNVTAKLKALEAIDREIVIPLHRALRDQGDYRILITPDHPTFLRTKTHSRGDVPWAMCGTGIVPDQSTTYDESIAARSVERFDEGWRLMGRFLGPPANAESAG